MSNYEDHCLWCGLEITEKNDSGWEAFTGEDGITQKICIDCNEKDNIIEKECE